MSIDPELAADLGLSDGSVLNTEPSDIRVEPGLERFAQQIFESGITFDEPKVKVLYKNVAPENIQDPAFLDVLKNIMIRRRVPPAIIASLFKSGQAAPETGTSWTGRNSGRAP